MVSEIKRKSLPAIAKAVGLDNQQNLHHFLTESPWSVEQLRQKRLELILKVVNSRRLILLIDETGDCKKGTSTDYVKRQYISNVGKQENGIVVVTAYGLADGMLLPLTFEVYSPSAVCTTCLVEQPRGLEALIEQSATDHSTADLLQLAQTMVACISKRHPRAWVAAFDTTDESVLLFLGSLAKLAAHIFIRLE